MGINNPVPQSLAKESRKAAKILASFVKPNQIISYDQVIPPHILRNAKGLVILTVLKAGFLFSGRAGSGVIVARLPDGSWSPPSAIMTGGAGVGGQIGAELTDFIFVLNNKEAVNVFTKFGSLTLGGNISLAAGPLGRNAEAAGAATAGSAAAIFSYSKTKGLFAGVSLEGSVIVERREANRKFYGNNGTAKNIISGRVPPPRSVEPLFRVLESRAFNHDVRDDYASDLYDDLPDDYSTVSDESRRGGRGSSRYADYDDRNGDDLRDVYDSPRHSAGRRTAVAGSGSSRRYADDYDDDYDSRRDRDLDRDPVSDRYGGASRSSRRYREDDDVDDLSSRMSRADIRSGGPSRYRSDPYDDRDYDSRPRESSYRDSGRERDRERDRDRDRGREDYGSGRSGTSGGALGGSTGRNSGSKAVALFTFTGEQGGDLSFKKGDVISIVQKSNSTDDWWTGELSGKKGIFPANYVELV